MEGPDPTRRDPAAPIGVFDSGVGGLTVLGAIHARLPAEGTVYLGDTARVPYGTRSARVVSRYAVNNARFLLGAADVKLLVVACNTASAVALPALVDAVDVPVLGVVAPGAQLAARTTRTGKVAVIGTRGTIRSGAYQRALAGIDPAIEVVGRPCPLFVPLAEEGWTEGPIARQIVERYLGDLPRTGVDTLVLGCTHYPLLAETIAKVLGDGIRIVDSAMAVAEAVAETLGAHRLDARREGPGAETAKAAPDPTRRIYVTDVPDAFAELAARFLGGTPTEPVQVDVPT
jgi:glutamate racemase